MLRIGTLLETAEISLSRRKTDVTPVSSADQRRKSGVDQRYDTAGPGAVLAR
jgi:hypothetical protein